MLSVHSAHSGPSRKLVTLTEDRVICKRATDVKPTINYAANQNLFRVGFVWGNFGAGEGT
jgi:hypothetical protein